MSIASLFIILVFLYLLILLALYAGFHRLLRMVQRRRGFSSENALPRVSIIVAARNEAHNLPLLLSCLLQQDYPAEKLEIVVVDDRSEDESWHILSATAAAHSQVKALRITDRLAEYAPKKRALDAGIRQAKGEILLLTDADCTPPPTWARSMVSFYTEDISVVVGYSPYTYARRTPAIVRGMLSLDCFAFAAVAAASTGWGQPLTATGTNLSYRRETYLAVGGFEPIKRWISGDDDLFMRHLAEERVGKFSYALDRAAFVPTTAPESWRQFWHQRIRFGSKGRHQRWWILLGTVSVYLLNVGIAAAVAASTVGATAWLTPAVLAWGVKSLLEFIFLAHTSAAFGEQKLLRWFLPTAFLHPFYITVFGFLGLWGKYEWKEELAKPGRDISHPTVR